MEAKKKKHKQKRTEKLKVRAQKSQRKLEVQFPHVAKKIQDLHLDLSQLRRHSAKMISAAALAGGMLLTSPTLGTVATLEKPATEERKVTADELVQKLRAELAKILPEKVGTPLSPEVESQAHTIIQQTLGVNAVGGLEGNHLNTTYGYMGAEQHLQRFPGDTIEQHDTFQNEGIAPGRGGWGYFAPSKLQMTADAYLNEKYYVAVQTLYLPNWRTDTKYLSKWYRYRKVLVINPQNGKAVVADIADAGPAAWTGKHFGGSPEVMAALQLNTGKQKGAVLLFFIDDKNQKIALGPVKTQADIFLAAK